MAGWRGTFEVTCSTSFFFLFIFKIQFDDIKLYHSSANLSMILYQIKY